MQQEKDGRWMKKSGDGEQTSETERSDNCESCKSQRDTASRAVHAL